MTWGLSILWSGFRGSLQQLFEPLDPSFCISNAAGLGSFIQLARLRGIAGDAASVPRLQYVRIVSFGQHKGCLRAAMSKHVFQQAAGTVDVGLPQQCAGAREQSLLVRKRARYSARGGLSLHRGHGL